MHEPRDILINRIIDHEADADDWTRLTDLAAHDPDVWHDLADAHLRHAALSRALGPLLDAAHAVSLPHAPPRPLATRIRPALAWSGWAAAAALLLALLFPRLLPPAPSTGTSSLTPAASSMTPDQALERYLDLGRRHRRVLAEIPERVVLRSSPLENDRGHEIIYLRQIIERAVVDDLYRAATDEAGRPVPVPLRSLEVGLTPAASPSTDPM